MAGLSFGSLDKLDRKCGDVRRDLENAARLGPARMREVMTGLDGRMRTIEALFNKCSESSKAQDLYSGTTKLVTQLSGQIREILRKAGDFSTKESLAILPDALWGKTFTFLDIQELPAVAQICRYFRRILSKEGVQILNSLSQRSSTLSCTVKWNSADGMVVKWNPSLVSMYNHFKPDKSGENKPYDIFDITASTGVNITELDLRMADATALQKALGRFAKLQQKQPDKPISIVSLKLSSGTTNLAISLIEKFCPKIRHLEFYAQTSAELQKMIAYLTDLKGEKTLQRLTIYFDRPNPLVGPGPYAEIPSLIDIGFFTKNPQLEYFDVKAHHVGSFLDVNADALAHCPRLTNVKLCGSEVALQGRDGAVVLTNDAIKLDNKEELHWYWIRINNLEVAKRVETALLSVAKRSGQLKTLSLVFQTAGNFDIQESIQKLISNNPKIEKLTLTFWSVNNILSDRMRITDGLVGAFPKTLKHLNVSLPDLNFARLKRIFELCPDLTICSTESVFANRLTEDYLLLRQLNRKNHSLSRLGELRGAMPSDLLNRIRHLLWIHDGTPDIPDYSTSTLSKEPTRLHSCSKPLVSLDGYHLLEQLESDTLQRLEIDMASNLIDKNNLTNAYNKRRLEAFRALLLDDEISPKQLLEVYKLLDRDIQGKLSEAVWAAEGKIDQWQYGENRIKEDPRCLAKVIDKAIADLRPLEEIYEDVRRSFESSLKLETGLSEVK